MVKVIRIIALLLWSSACLNAQNLNYARKVINDLCAPEMYGRGYVKKGDLVAAK